MNLQHLASFVRVAEHGSFSRAALAMGLAQPALSRQVRQLEVALRVNLLERTGRGVVLTEAGRRLLEHGHAILQGVARAEQDLQASRHEPAGHLVVGLPPSLGRQLTLRLAQLFQTQFPKGSLSVVEGLSAHISEWITTGRVDLGLLHHPEPLASLEMVPLHSESLYLLGLARSPLLSSEGPGGSAPLGPLPLPALADAGLVIPDRTHAIRRLLEQRASQEGVKLQVDWEVSGLPAIIDLVQAGMGHAVLGQQAAESACRTHALCCRPLGEPPLHIALSLAWSASRPWTPLQTEVAQWLRAQIDPS